MSFAHNAVQVMGCVQSKGWHIVPVQRQGKCQWSDSRSCSNGVCSRVQLCDLWRCSCVRLCLLLVLCQKRAPY
eukprot:776915-Amphidinium_carterae.4